MAVRSERFPIVIPLVGGSRCRPVYRRRSERVATDATRRCRGLALSRHRPNEGVCLYGATGGSGSVRLTYLIDRRRAKSRSGMPPRHLERQPDQQPARLIVGPSEKNLSLLTDLRLLVSSRVCDAGS